MQTATVKSAVRHLVQTAILLWILLLLSVFLTIECFIYPEVLHLKALAGVVMVWFLVAFTLTLIRVFRHSLVPGVAADIFCRKLARGDFPSPLPVPYKDFFPEMNRSLNLVRDRLQYLETELHRRQEKDARFAGSCTTAELTGRVYSRLLARVYQPLALLGGYLELSRREGGLSEEQQEVAGRHFADCVLMLKDAVDDMEGFAAGDADQDFDLRLFLQNFDRASQMRLRGRRMSLACRYGADLPHVLHGSRTWLERQMVMMLHILALEAENGARLELDFGTDDEGVWFSFSDPGVNVLASEYLNSRDAGDNTPGEETPLVLMELLLAVIRAEEHSGVLTAETLDGNGSRLVLKLGNSWREVSPEEHSGNPHFVESSAGVSPAETLSKVDEGRVLLIVRELANREILAFWHPSAEWTAVQPDGEMPEEIFPRIVAMIPAEIAERHLQVLEQYLCRAVSAGSAVTVIDPGFHRRCRRHLRGCGIGGIYDTRLVFREFGAAGRPQA